MARGDTTMFTEAKEYIADGTHDLDNDAFNLALITTLPTVGQTTPALGDFTEVTGGTSYVAGGKALTVTWAVNGSKVEFKHTGGVLSWAQDASGPANIVAGIIYNNTNVGKEALMFVDFTDDGGSTPVSLVAGAVEWDAAANDVLFDY